jgi:hypothetical protein
MMLKIMRRTQPPPIVVRSNIDPSAMANRVLWNSPIRSPTAMRLGALNGRQAGRLGARP